MFDKYESKQDGLEANTQICQSKLEKMGATNKTLVFSAVVRGFHVYRYVWNPHENEELVCFFEANNLFDMLAIRTCCKDCEKTVGHLPREISRPTKCLIERGAKITVKLSSIHYRRSPLFQGGLEIPCEVTVTIATIIKGHLLMQSYERMVHELYCEPKNEIIMGTVIENINVDFHVQSKKKKDTGKTVQKPKGSKDIRSFFQKR